MQQIGWSVFKDRACYMKARIKQMVKEWSLTKTVDDKHCFQNKEMIELLIADIANLEKQYNCDKEHNGAIQHINIQKRERDSIDDNLDNRIADFIIENKVEDNSKIQEHSLADTLNQVFKENTRKENLLGNSRMNPKYENDFLIMIQVVMFRMKEEKASLKNISFSAILKALVNEGQIQLKGWSSCKDRGAQMKARVKLMLKEWNLTRTVDNRN